MDIYHLLNLFFYAEIALLFLILLLIFFRRIFIFFKELRISQNKKKISQEINDRIEKKERKNPWAFRAGPELLEILESYNQLRFSGEEWELVKKEIALEFLLPKARKRARSIFWSKKNFAARCFALAPLKEDEALILKLLEDDHFLVRSIAAVAAVELEIKDGVFKIVENMSREFGYARFYYTDILGQGSRQVFLWISEIASSCQGKMHLACLEVLASRTVQIPAPFLKEDLQSKDLEIRNMALKICLRNPQFGFEKIFFECIESKEEEWRKIGAAGLANYPVESSIEALCRALDDSSAIVKLEAAKSLKKMDRVDLVKDQTLKQYVNEFGKVL